MTNYKDLTINELEKLIVRIEKDNYIYEMKIIKNQEYLSHLKQKLNSLTKKVLDN